MLRTLALLTLFALPAALSADDQSDPLPFELPTPEGWRTETIPFPLDFAPELDYRGLEELRFAPGMFTEGAEDYWTYLFVWWVDDDQRFEVESLVTDLVAYYDGLAAAVSESRGAEAPTESSHVDLQAVTGEGDGMRRVEGHATVVDAFVTRKAVELEIRARLFPCPAGAMHVAIFELSPQPLEHTVWTELAAIRDGFRCPD